MALPLSTPPEMGAVGLGGEGLGAGGGSSMSTVAGPVGAVPPPVPRDGPDGPVDATSTLLPPSTTEPLSGTGGTVLALVETSFGGTGMLKRAIHSVLCAASWF